MTMTATDRGWGIPDHPRGDAYRKAHIVNVSVGGVVLPVHNGIRFLVEGFLTQITSAPIGYQLDHVRDDWGFCYRPNRNNPKVLSNHSWGLAIDLNATINPNTHDGKVHTNMPPSVIEAAHTWGLSWGGDYHGLTKDPMHFEYLGTPADAMRLTASIQKFLAAASGKS